MLEINSFDEIRGNSVVIYSIKTLLQKHSFPKFTILSGNMGVGKSTVASLIADELNESDIGVYVFNFGLDTDMAELDDVVFALNPSVPRAFIFEELHGLNTSQQTALLNMLDKQPSNVYIISTTTEIHKVLRTVRSRAQIFDFKLLGERQLSQLLDDYLGEQGVSISLQSKMALLKSCHGVPRDLLKNTDMAIAGDFSSEQLSELLGQVSEDLFFSLLCTLKSQGIDFYTNITSFMSEVNRDKLAQFRDFFTRFLLERKGIEGATLSKERISTLNSLFTDEELNKIGRTLIRATSDTLVMELSLLNMELTNKSSKHIIGQQLDKVATNQAQASATATQKDVWSRLMSARITSNSLSQMKLEESDK